MAEGKWEENPWSDTILPEALEGYESQLRPLVTEVQSLNRQEVHETFLAQEGMANWLVPCHGPLHQEDSDRQHPDIRRRLGNSLTIQRSLPLMVRGHQMMRAQRVGVERPKQDQSD